jgi:hypothetical protein
MSGVGSKMMGGVACWSCCGRGHNTQRFRTPMAPSEIGSVVGNHRHGRFLAAAVGEKAQNRLSNAPPWSSQTDKADADDQALAAD